MMHVSNVQRTVGLSGSAFRDKPRHGARQRSITYVDPLDQDHPDDAAITMTERQLIRLLFVAAETGARFARERIDLDPAAWLFAGRRLFHGRAAVVACRERDAFVRALLLHGLSIGLDASPEAVDSLVVEGGDILDVDASAIRPKQPGCPSQLQPV
ncbi:MAG: hypothetical protein ACK4SZ_17310 [Allosphingosinicella sp.]|uniref:hypothetical protein n=1 Tax=Allosphingosinicella sp. TaxID=2823234 RepID=UPI00395E9EB9